MRKKKQRRWDYLGYEFKSKLEYDIGVDLINREQVFEYESQAFGYTIPVIHSYCNGCGDGPAFMDRTYTPDFFLSNGIIVEAKGRFTADERKKHRAMKEQHPDLDLRMLFQSDNYLTNNKKAKNRKRYSTWCNSMGIKWAIGKKIPQEWLDE